MVCGQSGATVTDFGFLGARRVALAAVVATLLITSSAVAAATAGPAPPKQFFRPIDQSADSLRYPVLAVAHNAGDNADTTHRALRHGADVIEIDVLVYEGKLLAAHNLPDSHTSRLGWRVAPPPRLEESWRAARTSAAIQLDVKVSDPALTPLLLAFLDKHHTDANWIVSSSDVVLLNKVAADFPDVELLLSIRTQCTLASFAAHPNASQSLTGVSVRASLLDDEAVTSFHTVGLVVLAWTVDDTSGLERALRMGVDGVATNNLAIIDYLVAGKFRLQPESAW
jgi:hypothetical protein